mmetsp:Transcript_16067/g.27113  ORF Transcript_16067/g.27113 Transcript_16067/m.27113 type:complete len:145 (-) Transcript_16067:17-451(-)
MSKKEFLDQFPKHVVNKGGNLIPIREELEKKFKETGQVDLSKLNSNDPIEAPTEVSLHEAKFDKAEVVTLRVRTETGKRTIIVKLLRSDKIAKLYESVQPYIEFDEKQFYLRTKFPNRAYEKSESASLQELGLAPSSAMVVQST